MMMTAHKNTQIKRIPSATKRDIALESLSHNQTVVNISRQYSCSRTTVYKQQSKAIEAINNSFDQEGEDVLFNIPVTKNFIYQVVLSLFLICKSSYRDIMYFLQTVFHYSLSLGAVFNIIDNACNEAISMNQSYDLSCIKTSAADELFHRDQPILAAVDIDSRFCALLAKAEQRDYETWGIHLLDMQTQGYSPETTIVDGAKGLNAGHKEALPKTRLRHDHFHIIKDLKDCGRFLKNQETSAVTEVLQLYKRKNKAYSDEKKQVYAEAISAALTKVVFLEETYTNFQLLSQWLQYDVLQLAGHSPEDRAMLYDFIVTEMTKLANNHPHRISTIMTSLNTQRDALLDVANTLNDKFSEIAKKYNQSLETIWAICYVTRYSFDGLNYCEKSTALESRVGQKYDEIEDEVLFILENTHRCSSMVENFNSRLRPYLDERKMVTQKILALIQFYLNHKPFMRSKHERLENKTPAESMTGKPHKPWLEMLGYSCFKRKAA